MDYKALANTTTQKNNTYTLKVLDKVNTPDDVKKLTTAQMKDLSQDIRYAIMKRSNTIGGHLGPDLGIVEATIAMHYVFNSPEDKIVFDVSHQCYPHKMLTGRKYGFLNPEKYSAVSGYTNPEESSHDFFNVGHTSTGVSLATGLAKARDLKGEKYNVIALVGDGSLSGGEAYEGLNNAAVLGSNFIVVVNDNEMAIAENHGGLYKNLALLRKTNGKAQNNIFTAMGFDYYYVQDGNDVDSLIKTFKKVKNTTRPTVVHIHTLKGKGLEQAVKDKETYHYIAAGALDKQKAKKENQKETYNSITSEYLLKKQKQNPLVFAISPATPAATGLTKEIRQKMGQNYTDTGIAEEHAVAFASGAAKNGAKPVLEVMSSFIQRTYDQLSQDLALNNSPATILVFGGGISGADMTHLGIFDIPLISNIPNIVYLSPSTKEEYIAMLDWSLSQNSHPVAIRVPSGDVVSTGHADKTDYSKLNKYKIEEKGKDVAIIAAGNFMPLGRQVKQELFKTLKINATLINPKFLSGVDTELLQSLEKDHKVVITLESGLLDGGFGEKISRFYSDKNMKVLNYGAAKEFTDREPVEKLYEKFRLTPQLITEDISNILKK
ncbi:TPA: 1-deoxy-D-xylulose-5-phosphate synthase [Candidatus Gastranaerophilales bacterium HUM_21]|nr:MAG TPA: 1-deoxy-D-xylulose-5-phosphate synthase [Candidatus Gastranaerophilales bacterium HUM_21]